MKKYSVTVELHEHYEIEAINEDEAIDTAINMATERGSWITETERIDLPENVIDLNRGEARLGDKIKFKNNDNIFIYSEFNDKGGVIIDTTDYQAYSLEEIWEWGFPDNLTAEWYRKQDDDDFWGVELIERKGE